MEIATTKLSSRGQIVIPLEMRRNLKEGENLVVIKKGNDLIIRKEESVLADWSDIDILADEKLLAEAWSGPEEDEAWKDL